MLNSTPELSNTSWKSSGIIILCVRFVQGWIFWGGGSRRFIYDPEKLDPYSSQWMANKLQSAMPGALLGIEHAISFLLQHFILLYAAIILFSLVELISGLALIFGFFTRTAAFATVMVSLALMLIFGWQGTTCMDEWTMASATLAMGLTLMLSGAPIYSIDNELLKRKPHLGQKKWFTVLASGDLTWRQLKTLGMLCLVFTVFFTLSTYSHYRGAIFSAYHSGPVSAYHYDLELSNGIVKSNGTVEFNVYVNSGPTAAPMYIIRIELVDANGQLIETWEPAHLRTLSDHQIENKYPYNRITVGLYGLVAPVSAAAKISLPPIKVALNLSRKKYQLQIYTVNGHRWDLAVM